MQRILESQSSGRTIGRSTTLQRLPLSRGITQSLIPSLWAALSSGNLYTSQTPTSTDSPSSVPPLRVEWASPPHHSRNQSCRTVRTSGKTRKPHTGQVVSDPSSNHMWRCLITGPESKTSLCWSLGRVVVLLYELLRTPLEVFGRQRGTVTFAIDFGVACFWTLSIPVTFLTGFYDEGLVEMRSREIAARYAKTWLVPDICIVGVDWFVCLVPLLSTVPPHVATVLRLVGFVRLSRTVGIYRYLNVVIAYIRSGVLQTLFRMLVKLAFIALINHWIACGWVLLGLRTDVGWMQMSSTAGQSDAYIYTTSLHWSLTQFTPAATNIQAHTAVERIYSICVILFALIVFSSFVSSLTTSMQSLHAAQAARESQELELRSFFVENNVTAELGTQISKFLTKYYFSHTKRTHESDFKFLESLPGYMRRQLREEHTDVV